MQIVIIEDEKPAVEKLTRLLQNIDRQVNILATPESVEEAVNWFENNSLPDLIFMDVQLDDGLCFEIFETVELNTPVIFTTAYDKYAIEAFKVNSVDYLLKPIEKSLLNKAIEKFKNLHWKETENVDYTNLFKGLSNNYKTRFLLKVGLKYKSIPIDEVQYFYITESSTFLKTTYGKEYATDYSLDQLQKITNPSEFYRINRNCLVKLDSIKEMLVYSSSRLQLKLHKETDMELFVVSRDKVSDFKRWMDR